MRVCFLPGDFDGPGCYRCLFPGRELREQGGHTTGVWPYGKVPNAEGSFNVVYELGRWLERVDADVFVLHHRSEHMWHTLIPLLRKAGRVVVCETDDYYGGVPAYNPGWQGSHPDVRVNPNAAFANRNLLLQSYRLADALTVSTPFLAERYARFQPDVTVLPNYLDWTMWKNVRPAYELERPRLRVGWMGRLKWHDGNVRVLQGLLGPWLARHPQVDFVAAGDSAVHDLLGVPAAQRVSYDPVHFHEGGLPALTATMDVGLVPLVRNGFNEAKSALKGMEYAACGIPCLATPTESYRSWIDEGETGFLCARPRDFVRRLDGLAADNELRRSMGAAARRKAAAHTIQQHWRLWEAVYARLLGQKAPELRLAEQAVAKRAIQRPAELAGLIRLVAKRKPRTVLEIGTAKGGTLWAWTRIAADDALIVSVDLPGGQFGGGYSEEYAAMLKTYARNGQRLECLRADSHSPDTRARLERLLCGRPVDFLFVDGDHTLEGVKADWDMYRPLLAPDGLVAFHDILKPGLQGRTPEEAAVFAACKVHDFWEGLRGLPGSRELVDEDAPGPAWGGIGVLELVAA